MRLAAVIALCVASALAVHIAHTSVASTSGSSCSCAPRGVEHAVSANQPHLSGRQDEKPCKNENERLAAGSSSFYVYIGVSIGLVALGGMMSGLTVGFFSIDPLKLQLLDMDQSANPLVKRYASAVMPLLERHHLLLVTLLVANAAAMEALPIFLDSLVPTSLAIILSVTFVLVFGEIVPQAVCTKDPLKIAAKMSPIVKAFIFVLFPICYPIAKLLDWVLGENGHQVLFKRSELRALVDLHAEENQSGGNLKYDEVVILKGALALREKTVRHCYTTLDRTFMLEENTLLDRDVMARIMAGGYSRIPVYRGESRHNIRGLLIVKRLIMLDPDDSRPAKDFMVHKPVVVPPSLPMYDMLNIFQEGRSHLALISLQVSEVRAALRKGHEIPPGVKVLGIITLEDVIEQLIQEDVVDETDAHELRRVVQRRRGVNKAVAQFKKLLTAARRRRRAASKKQPWISERSRTMIALIEDRVSKQAKLASSPSIALSTDLLSKHGVGYDLEPERTRRRSLTTEQPEHKAHGTNSAPTERTYLLAAVASSDAFSINPQADTSGARPKRKVQQRKGSGHHYVELPDCD